MPDYLHNPRDLVYQSNKQMKNRYSRLPKQEWSDCNIGAVNRNVQLGWKLGAKTRRVDDMRCCDLLPCSQAFCLTVPFIYQELLLLDCIFFPFKGNWRTKEKCVLLSIYLFILSTFYSIIHQFTYVLPPFKHLESFSLDIFSFF